MSISMQERSLVYKEIHVEIFNDQTTKWNDINRVLNLLQTLIGLENDNKIKNEMFSMIFYYKFENL